MAPLTTYCGGVHQCTGKHSFVLTDRSVHCISKYCCTNTVHYTTSGKFVGPGGRRERKRLNRPCTSAPFSQNISFPSSSSSLFPSFYPICCRFCGKEKTKFFISLSFLHIQEGEEEEEEEKQEKERFFFLSL